MLLESSGMQTHEARATTSGGGIRTRSRRFCYLANWRAMDVFHLCIVVDYITVDYSNHGYVIIEEVPGRHIFTDSFSDSYKTTDS